jgi:hypothetical protein
LASRRVSKKWDQRDRFPDVYLPFAQMPTRCSSYRENECAGLDAPRPLRQRAASLDPAIPVTSATTFEVRLADALQGDRFNLVLTSAFAAVAVLLASIGVFGAVAYAVQARTREFGVRLAFGARPSQLIGSALWRAGRIAVVGGAVGLGVTLILARVIGNALYLVPRSHNGLLCGVTTTDPDARLRVRNGAGGASRGCGAGAPRGRGRSRASPSRGVGKRRE